MGRLLSLLASSRLLAGILASTTPAEAVTCMGASDVTQIGPVGCDLGGLNFSNFNVSPTGVAAKILLGTFPNMSGTNVNMTFQVSHDPSPANLADILFYYAAKTLSGAATQTGVELFNPGQNVTIRETVCGTPFDSGVCNSGLLASLVVGSNQASPRTLFPALESTVYVRKDLQLLQNAFISEFTNQHDLSAAPEPTTMLLLGSSLVGLGMAARRRRARRR